MTFQSSDQSAESSNCLCSVPNLTIIGVGLIGGSFARAIREAGCVQHITGYGRNEENLKLAVELDVIDDYSQDIKTAVHNADLIFIATPVGSIKQVLSEIKNSLKGGVIITDAGSTKTSVINAFKDVFGTVPPFFIPGHPIAGTENSGVSASFSGLYQDHWVILTPLEDSDPGALRLISCLWQAAGAHVVRMDPIHHDRVLAATSHLPHLLAFSLVDTLATVDQKQEIFDFAAGGFKDFTRIASSDPVMWQDICLANKDALLEHIELFTQDLAQLTRAIKNNDADYLQQVFRRAKRTRDDLL
jgi:prephenate dehydrogenase